MATKAHARPLTGPLPGGSAEATVTVEPLLAGRAKQPPGFARRVGGRLRSTRMVLGLGVPEDAWLEVPIPAFLVRHPTAGAVLVDTGLHPSVASDPRDNLGRLMGDKFSLERGEDVPARLRERGLDPGDVGTVVLTHLHLDHASAISEFPNATFVVSAAEWEAATEGHLPALNGYQRSQFDLAVDFRTVDYASDAVSSYGPLARTFDLFGDGSIRLAFTPGHSSGHQSVVCRLPKRDFLIAGDALFDWQQMTDDTEPWRVPDLYAWRRSLEELRAYRREYPHAVICPGHDPEYWEKLEASYSE